ncbi:hypothetical protein ACHAPT_013244 [Fusarium lateritium]
MKVLKKQDSSINDSLVGIKRTVGALNRPESLRSFRQELRVLGHTSLKHDPNIIKLLFIGFEDISSIVLGFELAAFGTLADVLLSGVLPEDETLGLDLVLDVATGLAALHSKGIAHGDVKPVNVLVCSHSERRAIAKIADFSDSVFVQDLVGGQWQPLGGTHSWRAPECYRAASDIYDPLKTDIYSFGLCALAILAPAEGHVFGSPADCFLDRLYHGRDSEDDIRNVKLLANSRVLDLARRWAEDTLQNAPIKELSQTLSLACLSRLPGRRLDISSIVAIINRSEATSWKSRQAREWSRYFTALDDVAQLEQLMSQDLSIGYSGLQEDFLFMPSTRMVGLAPRVQQHIVQLLRVAALEVREELMPPVDESFLDGDFTLEDLDPPFQASTNLVPLPTMSQTAIVRTRRILGTLSLCYNLNIQGTMEQDGTDIAKTVAHSLARAGRAGVVAAITLYLNFTGSFDSAEIDAPFIPRKLWMVWGYRNGHWGAQDALRSQDPELYAKVARLIVSRQGPLFNDLNPTDNVKRLLEEAVTSGVELTELSSISGYHILDLAIYNGNIDLVRHIVEDLGFDINFTSVRIGTNASAVDDGDVTPTMNAAYLSHLEIFNFMLSKRPNLSLITAFGVGILHCIAWFPDEVAAGLVLDLVSHGASLTTVAKAPYKLLSRPGMPEGSPLSWAARLGKKSLVQSLLAAHQEEDVMMVDLDSTIKRAVKDSDVDRCALFLDHYQALHPSDTQPSIESLDRLLTDSIARNPVEYTSLAKHGLAASTLQSHMVQFLLNRGARPIRSPDTTSGQGNDLNPSASVKPDVTLMRAISHGCTEALRTMVEYLQSHGYDIGEIFHGAKSFLGLGAIGYSIINNQQSIFDYLMTLVDNKWLDVQKPCFVGRTALHVAAEQTNNTHYVRVLMRYGLKPHAQDDGLQMPFEKAVMFRNFEGAEIMLNDPRCDKAQLFETPNHTGLTLFEFYMLASLGGVLPELEICQVEFYERVGATKFAMTRPNVLRFLADNWPSTREEVRGFNMWLLDWLLDRMPAHQINNQDDALGFTALHHMGYHANFDGVAAMLQCDKVDMTLFTRKHNLSLFDCIFVECRPPFPDRLIQGGARELRGFQARITRLAELLLTTDISLKCSAGLSRKGQVAKELERLDKEIRVTLAEARKISQPDVETRIFETAIWPQAIPAARKGEAES